MEMLYTASQSEDTKNYTITGFVERKSAHRSTENVRHMSVIIIPFYKVNNETLILVHDRSAKQFLKGEDCKPPQYNLTGGHCAFNFDDLKDGKNKEALEFINNSFSINDEMPHKIFEDCFIRELSEELFVYSKNESDKKFDMCFVKKSESAPQFEKGESVNVKELVNFDCNFVGYSLYNEKGNNEISAVFTLQIPTKYIKNINKKENPTDLIAADDFYVKDGHQNICLPTTFKSKKQLEDLYDPDNNTVCDAISRLFTKWENRKIWDTL